MTLLHRLTQHPAAGELAPYYAERRVSWRLDIPSAGGAAALVPIGEVKPVPVCHRTAGIQPALAADHIGYVLGWSDPTLAAQRAQRCHRAFVDLLAQFDQHAGEADAARVAVDWFATTDAVPAPSGWSSRDLVTVAVDGHDLIDTQHARAFWLRTVGQYKGTGKHGVCSACGTTGTLLSSIPATIPAALLPGATNPVALVSNNLQVAQRGTSHSTLCLTCGDRVMSGIVGALSGSQQIMIAGQDTHHCWWYSDQPRTDWISLTCQGGMAAEDDLDQLRHDRDTCPPERRVYSLMLNAAAGSRATVQHFIDRPLREVLDNLVAWWERTAVPTSLGDTATPSLAGMVYVCGTFDRRQQSYTTPGSRDDRRWPWLYRHLATAALDGRPAPRAAAKTVLSQIKSDNHVSAVRASLLQHAQHAATT